MKKFDPDLQYLLWITEVAGLSPAKGVRLLERFGSAKGVWQASAKQIESCVKLEGGEKKRVENRSLALPNQILGKCDLQNIDILPITGRSYPDRLRNIYDPPLVLYVRGRLPDLNRLPAVAVVGQRNATPYGRIVAEKLGFHLSCAGVVVISGMAAGVDASAHSGALKGPTPTVAVFGTPIDQCYPSYHAALMRSILYHGAVLSEYPPGKKTYSSAFPARNRIISGLSLGVVVAEAPLKSGSLITAGHALDQGRDVFAVPGSVDAPSSAGCNELIARGAKLVRNARDILEEYAGLYVLEETDQPDLPEVPEAPKAPKAAVPKEPPKTEKAVSAPRAPQPPAQEADPLLEAIQGIIHLDDIAESTGLDSALLIGRLTMLEIGGKIRQLPGQYYERILKF